MPINFNGVEIGAVLTAIQEKKRMARAVLAGHLRDKVFGKDIAKDPRVCVLF